LFYFYEKSIAFPILTYRRFALAGLACAVAVRFFSGPVLSTTAGPFIGIPGVWILLSAAQGTVGPTRIQDSFGRASYHLFIMHMPLTAVLVTGFGVPAHSLRIYAATMAAALALSLLLVPMEHCIDTLRQRIARGVKEAAR
jgi:peptidoglycan/LPS O-acetylase OafA/YrhL